MAGGPEDSRDPAIADTPSFEVGETGYAGDAATAPAPARQAPRQVRTGDTLGRYELGEELGEGGMATVFRARDRELRRDVAVKVLFPHLARRSEIVRRFHREARAAAGLEHRNILRVYDVGGGDGGDPPYIVMELVRGPTLLQEIERRGAMLAELVASVGALLGEALAAAHAAGIIHRDVKPANVLIAPGGRLLLGDFGVARLETEDSLVTRTGALLGTPAYMCPEQATGDTATARSDLYSLGATLYQLATGTLPYTGSPAKLMSLILAGNLVSPMRRRSSCGPDLSRVIERMMAVDPAGRPASAAAVATELRTLVSEGGLGDPSEELAAYFEDPDRFLRAQTPKVIGALVSAAGTAIADGKLPRAMALADRASSLAPEDPAVTALVRTVTEGGESSRRKRLLALSGVALVVVAGVTAASWRLTRADTEAGKLDRSGGPIAMLSDAGVDRAPATVESPREPIREAAGSAATGVLDAAVGNAVDMSDAGIAQGAPSIPIDAATVRAAAPGSGGPAPVRRPPRFLVETPRPVIDASVAAPDASAVEVVAAPELPRPPPPVLDAGADVRTNGFIEVHNPLWCNIYVDGILHGNKRNEAIEVPPGRHVVRCVNPAGSWTQETQVAAGDKQIVTGTVPEIEVTLAIDATIDGKSYVRGSVVKLRPRNVEVIAGGKKQYITFRANCTLKDHPELGCYL